MKKTMLALAMVCAFGLAVTINERNAVAASGDNAAPAKKVTAQTTAPAPVPAEAPAPVPAPTPKKKKAIEGC